MTTPPSSSGPAGGRTAAVILAAGLGTRMRSTVPKVLHPLCGRAMLAYVLDAWEGLAGAEARAEAGWAREPATVVYSPATEAIGEVVGDRARLALQLEPRGTGDAVAAALRALPDEVDEVLVLSGDVPLVLPEHLQAVLEQRRLDDAAMALASVFAADPAELGRVVRGEFGTVERIVEARDASPEDLETNEVNAGLYAFDAAWLRRRIGDLQPSASNGELYLTDLVAMARDDGRIVSAVGFDDQAAIAKHPVDQPRRRLVEDDDVGSKTLEAPVLLRP